MSKYISVEKLIAEIAQREYEVFPTNDGKVRVCTTPNQIQSGWLNALKWVRETIISLQHEQPFSSKTIEEKDRIDEGFTQFIQKKQEQSDKLECVWIHKKYNRAYRIVSDNARLKNSNGEWIDCVIYAPLYENKFEMFAREKNSFYSEFEKVK